VKRSHAAPANAADAQSNEQDHQQQTDYEKFQRNINNDITRGQSQFPPQYGAGAPNSYGATPTHEPKTQYEEFGQKLYPGQGHQEG
jgi:hypothetical protein